MDEAVGFANALAVEHVNAALLAHQRIGPARHVAVASSLGARDDARLRPRFTLVGAAGVDDVLVRRRIGREVLDRTLRPHSHQRFVRSIEREEMFVARVADVGRGIRHEDHKVRLGNVQLIRDAQFEVSRRGDKVYINVSARGLNGRRQ